MVAHHLLGKVAPMSPQKIYQKQKLSDWGKRNRQLKCLPHFFSICTIK
jgi:hypothetical protein